MEPAKPKTPHPFTCFVDRLTHEKKIEAHDRLLEEAKAAGMANTTAMQLCRDRLGYLGPKEEKQLWEERHAELSPELEKERYKQIWSKLPTKAAAAEEMEWIAAHDLMDERLSAPDADDFPQVLSTHIENAPSKAAVVALKQWLADPREFQKARLSETRKHTDGGKSEEKIEVDLGVAEIERLLKEIKSG